MMRSIEMRPLTLARNAVKLTPSVYNPDMRLDKGIFGDKINPKAV